MKATKYTVTIKIEVLSLNVIPSITSQAIEQIRSEFVSGQLQANDGDTITWKTEQQQVNI